MKKRIWELDAARGLALLGMLAVHFLYDLVDLWQVFSWQEPGWYCFIKNNCGFIFLVISGISVTLGSAELRRGAQVFACGMLCTAVTAGMYLLGLADRGILIYFGVLHCLGVCMLLWHWLRRLPGWSVALLGLVLVIAGLILGRLYLDVSWVWLPLGLCPWWLSSSDYFPLLPNLGFFLLGAELGRTLYRDKKSRLPERWGDWPPVRLLQAVGRHSLWIYLLHQPVLSGLAMGIKWMIS